VSRILDGKGGSYLKTKSLCDGWRCPCT